MVMNVKTDKAQVKHNQDHAQHIKWWLLQLVADSFGALVANLLVQNRQIFITIEICGYIPSPNAHGIKSRQK